MASAAREISCAASALASGSMSEEFSGQMTNIGCGTCPARTCSASRNVSATWLSSTARRWALKSSPSRGTLPCTAATVTGALSPAPAPAFRTVGHASAAERKTSAMQIPGIRTAGAAAARDTASRRHQSMISSVRAATPKPNSATAKETSGAPPT